MIVDLNPLPYRFAIDIIKWCAERDIDREKCLDLIEAMSIPSKDWKKEIEWTLDIPDKYMTFFLLKWSGRLSESQIQ